MIACVCCGLLELLGLLFGTAAVSWVTGKLRFKK